MTNQQTPPPFCIHCAHFVEADKDPIEKIPRCGRARMLDIVMGVEFLVPCQVFRGEGAPCSGEGKLFEPKSKPENVVELN